MLIIPRPAKCELNSIVGNAPNTIAPTRSTRRKKIIGLQLCIFVLFVQDGRSFKACSAFKFLCLPLRSWSMAPFLSLEFSAAKRSLNASLWSVAGSVHPWNSYVNLYTTYFLGVHTAIGQILRIKRWITFFSSRIHCSSLLHSSICVIQVSKFSPICVCFAGTPSILLAFQGLASLVLQYGPHHNTFTQYPWPQLK